MNSAWSLQGSTALVTGAGGGIGRAIAIALACSGCKVIITGRRREVLDELAHEIGPAAHPLLLEMTDAEAIARLPAELPEGFRGPTVLVNNAAEDVGGRTRFDESSAEQLSRVIETNLLGVIRMTRALVPAMLQRSQGDIVNIGSTNAMRTTQNMAAYTASKTGLHGLTDVLRADYAKSGIRVIEIVPGLTKTGFAKARMNGNEEMARAYFDKFPTALDPQEIADSVIYALSRPRHVCVQQMVVTPSFQW